LCRTGLRVDHDCDVEDRGDCVFVLIKAEVPKGPLVEQLPEALTDALTEHNARHPPEERIRLRLALHAGEIIYDAHGSAGAAINLAFRLLDAKPLKDALAASRGVLAMVVSSWFYQNVVRQCPAGDPASYRAVQVVVKETDTTAWVRLPDQPDPPALPTGRDLSSVVGQPVLPATRVTERLAGNYTELTVAPTSSEIFFAVVDALEQLPCMRTENSRLLLIEGLRPAIAGAVRHFPHRRAHTVSILRTCLDYVGGLPELLDAVSAMEQAGSVPVQRLVDVLRGSGL
jgi:hypothetical protein